jgi:hypothetical protein
MNCAQQYVSKILKSRVNTSLDTLSKVEDALGINLINDEQTTYPTVVAEEELVQSLNADAQNALYWRTSFL